MRPVLCFLATALFLTACPTPDAVCTTGLTVCGEGRAATCEDLRSDPDNCGACGVTCESREVCSEGACVCAGEAIRCGDACVATSSNPEHCGGCGNTCEENEVCSGGSCVLDCPGGQAECGGACVNLDEDEANCGACGVTCEAAATCTIDGCRYDLVAACSTNGQLVGIQAQTDLLSPARDIGPNRPLAVVPFRDVLLVPDNDQVLSQARQSDLATVGGTVPVGSDARFVIATDPFVYVVNSVTGTLQIFEAGAVDGGAYPLQPRGELALSEGDQGNTFAQGVVKVGHLLYLPLQGGFGGAASEGQKVLKVNVANPDVPSLAGEIDLTGIDLQSFDGGTAIPRPADIAFHRDALYVSLANWDENYQPAGPGMLAKISLPGETVTGIDLGEDCLSTLNLESSAGRLFVSCGGRVEYGGPPVFPVVRADKAGLLVLDSNDAVAGRWASEECAVSDGGCIVPVPSRFAVRGGEVYVGDQNGGRLFVLEIGDNGDLSERRGYSTAAGPIQACAVDPDNQVSNVIDVVTVPYSILLP